jgi:DNA-binding NarL/FixJ family response regulator
MSIRIILVHDQELVRTGFRMVLEAQPDMTVAGEAADGLGCYSRSVRCMRATPSWPRRPPAV